MTFLQHKTFIVCFIAPPWSNLDAAGQRARDFVNKTQDTFTTSRNISGHKSEFQTPEDFNGQPNKTILQTLNSRWPRSKKIAFC